MDVKQAIVWVKEHIASYGGDPDTIVICGGSAGGHLAALAALTPNLPQFQQGFEHKDTAVQVGVTDLIPEMCRFSLFLFPLCFAFYHLFVLHSF